jgi:hypothetical protein
MIVCHYQGDLLIVTWNVSLARLDRFAAIDKTGTNSDRLSGVDLNYLLFSEGKQK